MSKNLLGVIAGQASIVAILMLVLLLSIVGAPLLQQKKVVAQRLGADVALTKAFAISEALLAGEAGRETLDTYASSFSASHLQHALAPNAVEQPAGTHAASAAAALRANPGRPYTDFENIAGNPHLFYGVRDRGDGLLLLDLALDRERATIGRFFGQSYLSMNALGYFLMALLLFGAFSLRYYLRSLIQMPEEERRDTIVNGLRGDLHRRRNLLPWLLVMCARNLCARHRQHTRLRGRHRLPARRRARAVLEPSLAHHADCDDQRAADADRADAVALRRQLVVVPREPRGRRVRDLRDGLLRLRQHAQIAGRSAGARRGSALTRRDRRTARSAGARRGRRGGEPPHGRAHPHGERSRRPVGVGMGHQGRRHAHRRRTARSSSVSVRRREFKGTEYTDKYVHPDDREGWVSAFPQGADGHRPVVLVPLSRAVRRRHRRLHPVSRARDARREGPSRQRARHRLGRDRGGAGEAGDRASIGRPARSAGALPARRVGYAGRAVRVQPAHRRDLVLAAVPPDARLRGRRPTKPMARSRPSSIPTTARSSARRWATT